MPSPAKAHGMADKQVSMAWVTSAASFGFALVQLDVSIVNVALPHMASDLSASTAGLQWVVDAYALPFAAFLLTMGSLGDRLGSRKIYLTGLAVFAAASLACALAPTLAWLVAGRALQGIGAAAMLPTSLSMVNHAAGGDRKARAKGVAFWTAAGSVAIAAGPLAGGLLVGTVGWRWIFLVNLPFCVLGAWLTWRVPPVKGDDSKGIDVKGQWLSVLALTAAIAAIIESRPRGFLDPLVLGCIVVALVCGAFFVHVERRAKQPMLPPSLFKRAQFNTAIAFGFVVNLTYYGMVFILSLYLQRIHGYSPVRAGLAYLPLTATFGVVNIASGWLISSMGPRVLLTVGALLDAAGFVMLALLANDSSYWAMLPGFLLLPAGMGLAVPAMTTSVLEAVDAAAAGVAGGVLNAVRQTGGAMGVAMFGALAGSGTDHLGAGLRQSSIISVAMLLAVAGFAARYMRHDKEHGAAR
jgi:DHA2 family methylenomycin A resistance protein-like MFS transporter